MAKLLTHVYQVIKILRFWAKKMSYCSEYANNDLP